MRPFSLLKKLIGLVSVMMFSSVAMAYQITLDTSLWRGDEVSVVYDLIDGSPGPSTLRFGVPLVDGVETGSAGMLKDEFFYNTIDQLLILGDELVLFFNLDTGGIPSAGFFPDSFAIFLLDAVGLPTFPTTDPTGADSLAQWDIGVREPTAFAGVLSNSEIPNPSAVPEPATWILFLIALGALLWQRTPQLISIFLGALVLANVSVANSAPSLNTTTDLGAQAQLTASGLRLNRQTNTFDSVLTIRNMSQLSLEKPFTVAVLSLPSGVILTNASAVSDENVPIITFNSGAPLAPGAIFTTTLKFVNQTNQIFPLSLRLIRLQQPIPALEQLQGPDANGNGVRDDLEPLLNQRYGNNNTERNAAIQVLKQMRSGLGASGSVESAFNAFISLNKAFDCMRRTMGLDRKIKESEYLRDQMMNTRERVVAWIALMNKVAGQSVPIRFSNACEAQ